MPNQPRRATDILVLGLAAYGRAVNDVARRGLEAGLALARAGLHGGAQRLARRGVDRVETAEAASREAPTVPARLDGFGEPNSEPVPVPAPRPAVDATPPVSATTVEARWSALLAAEPDGRREGELIARDLLARLTPAEARIVAHVCVRATKQIGPAGFILAEPLLCAAESLLEISGLDDVHHVDRALDHLRSLELLCRAVGGFDAGSDDRVANVTPTALALGLYARCQGSEAPAHEYFGLERAER